MRFLRVREVAQLTGYSVPHIWRLARDGQFPKPVKLGANASAWVDGEVREWQLSRIKIRDTASATV